MPITLSKSHRSWRWRPLVLAGSAIVMLAWAGRRGASGPASASLRVASTETIERPRPTPATPRPSRHDNAALVAELRARLTETDSIAAAAEALRAFLPHDGARALNLTALVARNSDERYQLVSRLLPDWAAADPDRAWQWAIGHNEAWSEGGQSTLTELVLARLAADSPAAIAMLLSGNEWAAPAFVDQGLTALLQTHHGSDAQALLEQWARADPPDHRATTPFERTAFALAQDSPVRAAEWLLTLPPSLGRDAGLGVVADVWASADASAAIAWARTLPPGDTQSLAVERAFGRWVEHDGEAALRWLVAHEAEPNADRLIARWLAVSDQLRAHPAAARPWLDLIRDPVVRARSAELVLHQ